MNGEIFYDTSSIAAAGKREQFTTEAEDYRLQQMVASERSLAKQPAKQAAKGAGLRGLPFLIHPQPRQT